MGCEIQFFDKKSCFRLHGSYEALKYGTSLDGLSDLTGGIAENIVLQSQSTDISNVLAHLLKLTSIILCKVEAKNADDVSIPSFSFHGFFQRLLGYILVLLEANHS